MSLVEAELMGRATVGKQVSAPSTDTKDWECVCVCSLYSWVNSRSLSLSCSLLVGVAMVMGEACLGGP